jgi:neutral ceramidase
MNPRKTTQVVVFVLFLIIVSGDHLFAAAETQWQAASGSVVITPDEPLWMAGYASRTKPAEGKLHDLHAKILLLEDRHGTRLAIVTYDLIGIHPNWRDPILSEAQKRFGLGPESILLNASHTHSGPELRESNALFYGGSTFAAKSREYSQSLVNKTIGLIEDARTRLQPVTLTYSSARAGFAMNRRLPTANGVQNSLYPDGPVDHRVPVLQVKTADNQLNAVLFGYACHATTLSIQQFNGDYAGFAQVFIEKSNPGVTAMFLNGCSADQNPQPRRTIELAEQHGRALANGVAAALQTKFVRTIDGPLKVAMSDVELRFDDPPSREELNKQTKDANRYVRRHAQRLLKQLDTNGHIATDHRFPLQVVQFGNDLTLVAICGETVVDYSLRLQRELFVSDDDPSRFHPQPPVWVSGYNNHVFGYLPSRRVLEEGGYEGGGAMTYTGYPGPFAADVEERVVETIHELVRQVRSTE